MSRVAVVTGGTRGIGAAISKALAAAGYSVAAVYHGNDAAAAKFKAETGVGVYKWDVADFDACSAGLAQVAKDLGRVEILVNNAGVTRDGMFHKMTPDQWYGVINTNPTHASSTAMGSTAMAVGQPAGTVLVDVLDHDARADLPRLPAPDPRPHHARIFRTRQCTRRRRVRKIRA